MAERVDTLAMRKERGAFFTPPELAEFISEWAVRGADDRVLEPSCGDAVFLRAAGRRLVDLGAKNLSDQLVGYDIHADSLLDADALLSADGLESKLELGNFFEVPGAPRYSAVIGNPPFIRFQGFAGTARQRALERASLAGVDLSGLASSWAAFVAHSASFLKKGGRLGFVLPAELMSVNYAGPIRRFLLEKFATVDLIVFDELVFAGIQADVVVLLADGYGVGAAGHFRLHSSKDVHTIHTREGKAWTPSSPSERWTDALAPNDGSAVLKTLRGSWFVPLENWGRATSGIVTGANSFFTMTRKEVIARGFDSGEVLPVLPAGSSFTSRTSLTRKDWSRTAEVNSGFLFSPGIRLSGSAERYVKQGEELGLDQRYKCRIRDPWWQVPLGSAPDLFVSYMSGSTPRIVSNDARVLNLNSVHGLRVSPELSRLARASLPVMAMSSASLLSAELVGRTYGGGILKLEPKEASQWLVPSPELMRVAQHRHSDLLRQGRRLLNLGDVNGCTAIADQLLLSAGGGFVSVDTLHLVRETRLDMVKRRVTRAASKVS